jgi:hypothetical protein
MSWGMSKTKLPSGEFSYGQIRCSTNGAPFNFGNRCAINFLAFSNAAGVTVWSPEVGSNTSPRMSTPILKPRYANNNVSAFFEFDLSFADVVPMRNFWGERVKVRFLHA